MQKVQAALAEEQQRRERFYEEMTEQQKVEFINGQIFMHSPVKKRHNQANLLLAKLISTYVDLHDLGFIGIEKILITLTRNDYDRIGEPTRYLLLLLKIKPRSLLETK